MSTHRRANGFTLVELLTVVFIIALLIGILVPSLSAARSAAKRTASAQALKAIEAGLEMFRQDNESDFAQTNGYPPSYSYPGRFSSSNDFDRSLGQFPFFTSRPTFYGAMWLPAMLSGVDRLGYIEPDSVPKKNQLNENPDKWYRLGRDGEDQDLQIARSPYYLDPDNVRSLKLRNLPGRPPDWWVDEGTWGPPNSPEAVQNQTVLVDAFDYPILYYAANRNGRATNMVSDERNPQNEYTGGPQEKGPPYYFHVDNHGFTGHSNDGTVEEDGWDFNGEHPMAEGGGLLTAEEIVDESKPYSFARHILDRKLTRDLENQDSPNPNAPLRPVNADSYLLISPGPDGKYGTKDDVSNMPGFLE